MQNAVRTTSNLEMALAVCRRRKWPMLLVFIASLSATVAMARNLPKIYESTATVLVEHQHVPHFGGPSVDEDPEAWLRNVIQQTLSRSRLDELITRLDLYPELRHKVTPEGVADRMRRDIRLQYNGVRKLTGQEATTAFNLSYRGRDPVTVAQTTNALAALIVEENTKIRAQQTEFLRAQLEDAKRQLEEQELRISQFKVHYNGELPEQQMANLATLERLNAQLIVLMYRRDALSKRLADGPAGNTPSARLAKLNQELSDLRTRDTEDHPDVVRVKNEIAALEDQVAAGNAGHTTAGGSTVSPADPMAEAELAALRNEEQGLRHAIAGYQQRVENAPLREQQFQQLSRDYSAAKELYQSLLQRYEDAQLAEREQRLQAGQFRILDPALVPRQPAGPNRLRLLLMGLVMSVGASVGMAVLAEVRDTSFHTVDDVRAFTTVPVLVSIPPITTQSDARRHLRRFVLVTFAAAIGIAGVVGLSSYLAHSDYPLVYFLTPGRF